MSEIKRMDIAEFRAEGYLQEVNRQFLHPHGLALEVVIGEDGSERLGGVWDYRDDPEGIYFGDGPSNRLAVHIDELARARAERRKVALGYVVQPPVGS